MKSDAIDRFRTAGLNLATAELRYRAKKTAAFLACPETAPGKPAPEAVRVNYSDQAACEERAARDRCQVELDACRYEVELMLAAERRA